MTQKEIERATALFKEKLTEWGNNKKKENSAYEYEKTFVETMQKIEKEVLQIMTETKAKSRNAKKKVLTIVGMIEVSKKHILSKTTGRFRITPYTQEMMCYVGQQKVFSEAAQLLKKTKGINISDKQIENVCHYYGEKLEEKIQQEIISGGAPPQQNDGKKYYAMLDGGMLLTREEKWKEMKLARIFDATEIISINKNRNYIGESTYVAHLGNHKPFLQKVENHLDDKGEIIFIADGAKWIWKWVEAMYPESTQILDYYHAKQHLCQWAEMAIKDEPQKKNWIHTQCFWLLNNGIDTVIENIKQLKVNGTQARKVRQLLIAYYTANRNRMQYKTYKEHGLMIGSGPIEAAHRHVVQQRMKLSGQRWTIKGAQQIVNLRVAEKSNNWAKVIEIINKAA